MKTTHEFNSSCFEGLWINKCRAFSVRATHEIIEYANSPFNTFLMWNCPKIWTVTEGCREEAILKIRWMVIDFFLLFDSLCSLMAYFIQHVELRIMLHQRLIFLTLLFYLHFFHCFFFFVSYKKELCQFFSLYSAVLSWSKVTWSSSHNLF